MGREDPDHRAVPDVAPQTVEGLGGVPEHPHLAEAASEVGGAQRPQHRQVHAHVAEVGGQLHLHVRHGHVSQSDDGGIVVGEAGWPEGDAASSSLTCTTLSDGVIRFLFTRASPVALFTSANARWPSSSVTIPEPLNSWTQCCCACTHFRVGVHDGFYYIYIYIIEG
jgi:hypothetical protein